MTKISWALDPTTTALVVMDLQNDFLLPTSLMAARGGLDVVPRVNRLIATARTLGMPLVFTATTHVPGADRGRMGDLFPARGAVPLERGTPGWRIHPDVDFRPGDTLVEKPRYSAFWKTGLDDLLRSRGVDTIVLGGVWANVCVESTARDALFRDYRVVYLADCTAAGDMPDYGHGRVTAEDAHRITLTDIAMHIGEVAKADDVIARLERAARPCA